MKIEVTLYTDDSGANAALRFEATYALPARNGGAISRDAITALEIAALCEAEMHACECRVLLGVAARGEFTVDVYDEDGALRIDYEGEDLDGEEFGMCAIVKEASDCADRRCVTPGCDGHVCECADAVPGRCASCSEGMRYGT